MNKISSTIKTLLYLNLFILNPVFTIAQQHPSSFLDLSSEDMHWHGNNHFVIQNKNDVIQIEINKMPWEAFTLDFKNIDLTNYPLLRFQVKSDVNISLRVDVLDFTLENKIQSPITEAIPPTNDFIYVQYDLRSLFKNLNTEEVAQLKFFVNPGEKFKGKLLIKNIHFLDTNQNTNSTKKDVLILSNTKRNEVTIQSLQKEFDQIKIYNEIGQLITSSKMESSLTKTFPIERQGIFFIELFKNGKPFHVGQFIN